MPGVEILHSSEVLASGGSSEASFVIAFITCTVIGLTLGSIVYLFFEETRWVYVVICGGIMFGLLIGAIMSDISSTPEAYETHYKVLISDEVSMNEFLEHYEIVDQEGKIYTVKERAEED